MEKQVRKTPGARVRPGLNRSYWGKEVRLKTFLRYYIVYFKTEELKKGLKRNTQEDTRIPAGIAYFENNVL